MAHVNKPKAIALRKRGKSYNYISSRLSVPKSTLSNWFSDLKWSQEIKQRNEREAYVNTLKRIERFVEINRKRWREWREKHVLEAIDQYTLFKNDSLFNCAVMLYWAEGDTGGKTCNAKLTNTDPRMIKLFIRFGVKYLGVNLKDIRISLILYPDLNETICKHFWSKQTDIPIDQFYKTQYIKGYHPTARLEYGICMAKIGGVGLREKIKAWIDLCAKDLVRG